MKRATLVTALALGLACVGLTGCVGQTDTFTIADSASQPQQSSSSAEPAACVGITSDAIEDIVGEDLGQPYVEPLKVNGNQFDSNACAWSNDTAFVWLSGIVKPVFPEQVISCNLPPLRGNEELKDVGNPGWWTWEPPNDSGQAVLGTGQVSLCDGPDRVRVQVGHENASESEIKQQAVAVAKLVLQQLKQRGDGGQD